MCRELFGLRGKLTGVEGVFQERDWPVEVKIGRECFCVMKLLGLERKSGCKDFREIGRGEQGVRNGFL